MKSVSMNMGCMMRKMRRRVGSGINLFKAEMCSRSDRITLISAKQYGVGNPRFKAFGISIYVSIGT